MKDDYRIERRTACAALLGVGASALLAEQSQAESKSATAQSRMSLKFKNSDFYSSDGKFDEAAAKAAYFKLMKVADAPVSEYVQENLWVTDFALGRFTEVGIGGVFWVNDKKWNYASVDIFLLPNQMIPEHWHIALESEGVAPKMESWIVRYGTSYTYGEGKPTPKLGVKIHDREANFITAKKETVLDVGDVTGLLKPLEKHWQQAGPEGAIITEVSTYHTGDAVRFTNPDIKF